MEGESRSRDGSIDVWRRVDSELPHGHVARPRLVELARNAHVVTVVAGGGWGKTTFSLEFARTLECRTVALRLEQGDDPAALRSRLRRGLRRAGLSDLMAALDGPPDPAGAIEAMLDGLARESSSVLLIVDEVEHAEGDVADQLALLATDLPTPHRAVLVGRMVPVAVTAALDHSGVARIGPRDLAFTEAETMSLAAQRPALGLSAAQARALLDATNGWAAALTVACERLRGSVDIQDELDRMPTGATMLGDLVATTMSHLSADTGRALGQIAHLVPLPLDSLDRIAAADDLAGQVARAGIPFDLRRDGFADLTGPVREAIVALAPLVPESARRAAEVWTERGEHVRAIRLLITVGDADRAAELLASVGSDVAARLDYHELQAIVTAIGPPIRRHPRALLHLARSCEAAAEARVRADALGFAAEGSREDPMLAREVDAERARDLVRDGHVDEAASLAERLLADAGPDELQTRVRALHVLGRTHAWRGDTASLAAAEPLLEEAAALYLALGNPIASAHAQIALAYDVYTLAGRSDEALSCLEQAAAILPSRARLRGIVLDFTGEALVDIGRDAEAQVALAEAERIGRLLGDTRTIAYSAWVRARIAARQGDANATRSHLEAAERSQGEWFDHHSGAEFLAEAAALLHEVGLPTLGDRYLGRARERRAEAPRYVLCAEGAVEARSGDPTRATKLLAEALADVTLEGRLRWRVALLRAWSVYRVGDGDAAATFAKEAFELAAATGHPELPLLWEEQMAEALRPLAACAAGGVDVLATANRAARVTVLGAFAVEHAGTHVELPPGRPAQLLAVVCAQGGRITTDQASEALWPGADAESGRKRLRNVLNRLREAAGDVVVRGDDALGLAPAVEVDAVEFARDARMALVARGRAEAFGLAQAALARYAGELLPGYRYEEWAMSPRERLRALALDLIDLLAEESERSGDLDDTLRFLEQGIEWDRLDEERYLRAARVMLAQGRRGRALDVLRQAASALRELGLEPSDAHRALVRSARD